jgi:hypothetical protein
MYVHNICLLFTPEYCVDVINADGVVNIKKLKAKEPERGKLKCNYCDVIGGSVQCNWRKCMNSVHPYCGQNHPDKSKRFMFRAIDIKQKNEWLREYEVYCDRHVGAGLEKQRKAVVEEGGRWEVTDYSLLANHVVEEVERLNETSMSGEKNGKKSKNDDGGGGGDSSSDSSYFQSLPKPPAVDKKSHHKQKPNNNDNDDEVIESLQRDMKDVRKQLEQALGVIKQMGEKMRNLKK